MREQHWVSSSTSKRNRPTRPLFFVSKMSPVCAAAPKQNVGTPQACHSLTKSIYLSLQQGSVAVRRRDAFVRSFLCHNVLFQEDTLLKEYEKTAVGLLEKICKLEADAGRRQGDECAAGALDSPSYVDRERPKQLAQGCLGSGDVGGRRWLEAFHCVLLPVRHPRREVCPSRKLRAKRLFWRFFRSTALRRARPCRTGRDEVRSKVTSSQCLPAQRLQPSSPAWLELSDPFFRGHSRLPQDSDVLRQRFCHTSRVDWARGSSVLGTRRPFEVAGPFDGSFEL